MKLLLTTDTVGGVWTYAVELARALRRHDVEIALATMGGPLSASQRAAVAPLRHVEVFESTYQLMWMDDPWDEVERAGDCLRGVAEEVEPDLVHLNDYAHATLPWDVPVLVVGHSCVRSWWSAVRGGTPPKAWDRYSRRVARALESADAVVAPTWAMLAALDRHYGPLARGRVIANARDPERYRPGTKEPFVLSAGRIWDEAKNIHALAEAATSISWPVHVAGTADHPDGGTAHFENVHLLGRIPPDDLADRLGHASIYALPARYEPFGLSALEAAHAGCALVLGDINSLREVWGDAALYASDAESLAHKIQWLIDRPAARERFARNARKRAERYTPERQAAAYHTLYQELLQHADLALPSPLTPAA
jgi:glycogen(starch) synthase